MAISTNAILSIEQTLAKVLETAWQNEFTTLKVKLSTLVEMGEYDQAYDLAYKLDLAPLFSKHREYIKYATYSAMLFGASRVTPRVERSGFAKGSWGDTVATVLDTFRIQIELLVGEQARKALLKELDQLVDAKRQEQISSVEKANPWRDKEGKYTDEANDADGVPEGGGPQLSGDDIKLLDEAIHASPLSEDTVLYRGLKETPNEVSLTDGGFVSTSSEPTIAYRASQDNGTVLVFHLPKGFPALNLSSVSSYPEEREFLLGRNIQLDETRREVTRIRGQEGQPDWVEMTFIHVTPANTIQGSATPEKLKSPSLRSAIQRYSHIPGRHTNRSLRKKAEDRILKPFQTFDRTGLGYLQLVSQLHTSRVSAFGFTAEADIVGLTEYAITEQLDNRVCSVCEAMHGRTFRVDDARNALNTILRVKDPNELKVLQAWPRQDAQTVEMIKGMSDSDLISRNWHLPPYHPWCRGLLVRVGKVPKLKPKELGAVETPEVPEEITQDNFNNLGVEISDGNVERWKATVGATPEEFLSRVSGKSTAEFQHDLYRNSTEPSLRSAGISRFRIDDNGRVTVGGLIPGGRLKHWEIELDLLDRKWAFKKFTSKDYDHLKALWENWSDYFAELGLTLAGD